MFARAVVLIALVVGATKSPRFWELSRFIWAKQSRQISSSNFLFTFFSPSSIQEIAQTTAKIREILRDPAQNWNRFLKFEAAWLLEGIKWQFAQRDQSNFLILSRKSTLFGKFSYFRNDTGNIWVSDFYFRIFFKLIFYHFRIFGSLRANHFEL